MRQGKDMMRTIFILIVQGIKDRTKNNLFMADCGLWNSKSQFSSCIAFTHTAKLKQKGFNSAADGLALKCTLDIHS